MSDAIDVAPVAQRARATLAPDERITCAACGRYITRQSERLAIGGGQAHTRVNPHGYCYTFHTFGLAPGCTVSGTPTDAYSWFAGYRWQLAACGGCGEHLGWAYSKADGGGFFALIDQRLCEERQT